MIEGIGAGMDYLKYQKKINDVITKAPIETGIEILVYCFLDSNIDETKYTVADINRVRKKCDQRLRTDGGISDLAVLSPDFVFKDEKYGEVYGFIEVKTAGAILKDTEQTNEQMKKVPHFIYTNGLVWKYYLNCTVQWEIILTTDRATHSFKNITIDEDQFKKLEKAVGEINWKKN